MLDSAASVLLKINEALLVARDERDILACIALCADPDATVRLIYLERNIDGSLIKQLTVVASWQNGRIWQDDTALKITVPVQNNPLLAQAAIDAEQTHELVWLINDLDDYKITPMN